MMVVDNKFSVGDKVYLVNDPAQMIGLVTQIVLTERDIIYTVSFAGESYNGYGFEFSTEKNYEIISE